MYPYQFRVVPYYRNTNLMQWNPNHLTAQHFKSFTDLIYFNVGCDTEGNLTGQNNAQFLNGLDKLKNLRGTAGSKIILGVAHCDGGLTAFTGNAEKRRQFAYQLVSFAREKGFDGIDIDWEYPDNGHGVVQLLPAAGRSALRHGSQRHVPERGDQSVLPGAHQ